MKLKNIILLTGMLLPVSTVFAQYAEDALRFSQTEQGATARFRALGSAQTALGGDASSLASNPAGLGLFTRSELSFTPDISSSSIKGNYLNGTSSMQKDGGGINQFAVVFYNPTKRSSNTAATTGWLSFNFGIAYNKTNNFNNTTDYNGLNPKSSFADYLSELALDPDDALATAGYDSHLVELDANTKTYFPISDINNTQVNTVFRTGNQSEVNFSLGGNYSNQLYIGGSIGLTSINYNADRRFNESGLTLDQAGINSAGLSVYDETKPYLNAGYTLSYRSNQITDGTGINAKLGLIYRLNPSLRFGLNFISPTWYTIDDSFSEGLGVRYTKQNGTKENLDNADNVYSTNYSLRTPYKINAGAAIIINKFGLLTGDVEYVDYASMHFSTDSREPTNKTNGDIRSMYQSAVNLKVGAEVKLNPLMIRAGYNINGNPYQNGNFTSNAFTTGLGYRINNLSFDITYVNSTTTSETSPYQISQGYRYYSSTGSGEVAKIEDKRNNVFATIGFRF